jgi:hypothetical protein
VRRRFAGRCPREASNKNTSTSSNDERREVNNCLYGRCKTALREVSDQVHPVVGITTNILLDGGFLRPFAD